jgi:hypothetical protein
VSDETTSSTWLLNTYYGSRPDGHTLASFPLLFTGRSGAQRYTVAPPLVYANVTDDEAGTSASWLLNTYYASRPDGFTLASLPLVFAGRQGEDRYTVAAPLFWRVTAPGRSDTAVAPLWFGGERGDFSYTVAPPLLYGSVSDASDGTSSTWLLNTYYGTRPDGFSLASFPLLFAGRTGEDRYTVAPPLLYGRVSDETTSSTWLLNTYYGSRPDGHTLASFPLLFSRRDGEESTTIVPPLLYGRRSDATTSSTWLLNTYYGSRPDGFTLASLPLVFAGREGQDAYTVAAPLFWRFSGEGRSDTGVFPLWFGGEREAGASRYDVVPPLLFARSSDATSSATWAANTFYASRPDGHTLISFPLALSHRDGACTTTVVPPALFARTSDEEADTSATWLLNTYYASRPDGHTLISLPLALSHRDGACTTTVVPPALFARTSDDEAATSSTWLLNTYYGSRPDGHTLASFPLLFTGRTGSSSYAVAPPLLFGHASDETSSSTWLLNTYYGSRPDGHTLASFPLLFTGRTGSSSYAVAPPLLFGRASDDVEGTSSTWLLNTYYGSRPDGYSLASFPLVFASRDGEDETLVVPPLLTYHDREGETSRTFIANSYLRLSPDGWAFNFLPLLFSGRDGDRSHAVGFPLLWHFADATSSTTVVGPGYHVSGPDGSHSGVAPLWFSGRSSDGSEYDIAAPLVWRFAGPDGTRLAVLPFFDYSQDATRTRVVSPFFYHSSDADQVERASSSTIVLGLYWDWRTPELNARVAFPLWWEFSDPATGNGLSTLFPLYWRRDTADETTSVLVNTVWTSGPDSWSFHFAPLVSVGSDSAEHFRWQVLGGLLGHERRGARHRWRFGYVWTDPSEG